MMMPTADHAARAIVEAFTVLKARRSAVLIQHSGQINKRYAEIVRRARTYAAVALREKFPTCSSPAIGRMVGAAKPGAYLGIILAYRAKGLIRWFDPVTLERVKRAIGEVHEAGDQPERDETVQSTIPPARPSLAPPGPGKLDFVRVGSKKRLEEELRQALINSGGRPA